MKIFIKKVLLILFVSLFIEIFIFNFNSLRSYTYKPFENDINIFYGDEFIDCGDSHILDSNYEYSTIEIYNINDEINNVYVDFNVEGDATTVKTSYYLSDEGNVDLYSNDYGKGVIWNQQVSSSSYVTINPYGNVNTIVIKVFKDTNQILSINSIGLNVRRPVFFSIYRFLFIFILTTLITIFLKDHSLYSYTFKNTSNTIQKIVIICLIVIQLLISLSISNINTYLCNDYKNDQYLLLTDGLIEGRFDLNITPNKNLLELENPYDLTQRIAKDCDEYFDHAYYNGKFYCYFGVAPVITFYLPYKLLTGSYISDSIINSITFTILSVSIITLFFKIIKKNFSNTPICIFVLLTIFAINTCGALTLLAEPRIYTVPILYGLAFSMAALSFWVNSIKDNSKLNNIFVVLGSICIGLGIASRPQFALFAFLAIIIFFDQIKDIRNNIKSFVLAIIPLTIIGSLLMYYNYARFSTPFDFGANYNLTFNDMTKRGFKFDRISDGLFFYLLQPMSITSIFPYINQVKFETNYIGMLVKEYSFGGLLTINPLTIISLSVLKFRNKFTNKKLLISSILLTIFGFVLVLVDTQMAGLVERYFSDFSIFFILSSVLIILTISNNTNNKTLYKIVFVLVIFALAYSTLRLFTDNYMTLETCNPNLYYKIYCLTQL